MIALGRFAGLLLTHHASLERCESGGDSLQCLWVVPPRVATVARHGDRFEIVLVEVGDDLPTDVIQEPGTYLRA